MAKNERVRRKKTKDWINFRGVCHSWREAPSCRFNITEFCKRYRWCIFYDCDAQDRDVCYFYQPGNPKIFSLRLPMLRGATCLVSKFGWLLIRRNIVYILFNPVTHAEILLPTLSMDSAADQLGIFSALPTDTECKVIVFSSIDSSTVLVACCGVTDNQWMVKKVNATIDSYSLRCIYHLLNQFSDDSSVDYDHLLLRFLKDLVFGLPCKIEYALWFSWMKDVHLDNWLLCKFGKEFTISFNKFDPFDSDWGRAFYDRRHWIVRGTNAATVNTVNAPVIKATWIDVAAFRVSKKPEAAPLNLEDAPQGYNLRPHRCTNYRGMD